MDKDEEDEGNGMKMEQLNILKDLVSVNPALIVLFWYLSDFFFCVCVGALCDRWRGDMSGFV